MKPQFLVALALLLLFPRAGLCRTRADVLADAKAYSTYAWTPSTANLMDVKRYVVGSTIPVQGENDGIDDRMGLIEDTNQDGEINYLDISDANRRRWPFIQNSTVDGEAYAFGFWDSTSTFEAKLDLNRIVGAGQADSDVDQNNEVDVAALNRFAGLDCSGFVSLLLKSPSKYGTAKGTNEAPGLPDIAVRISTADLKSGDYLLRYNPGHVVVFSRFIDDKHIEILQAGTWRYSEAPLEDKYIMRVAKEITEYKVEERQLYLRYSSNDGTSWEAEKVTHYAYSPFPQFRWSAPAADYAPLDPVDNAIALRIDSARALSKVDITLDPGTASSATARMMNEGLYLSTVPAAEGKGFEVRWRLPASFVLEEGTHTLVAYAINDLGLEDWATAYFYIGHDNEPPRMAWEDAVNLEPVFGYASGLRPAEEGPWFHGDGLRFELSDYQSPLSSFTIFSSTGAVVYHKDLYPGTKSAGISDAIEHLPDAAGYRAALTDRVGNATTMYFHIDRSTPLLVIGGVVSRLKGDLSGHIFDISGTASDYGAGLGGPVLDLDGSAAVTVSYDGPSWPAGDSEALFNFTDRADSRKFAAFDRSGWRGVNTLQVSPEKNYPVNLEVPGSYTEYQQSGLILAGAAVRAYKQSPHMQFLNEPEGLGVTMYVESHPHPAGAAELAMSYAYSYENPGAVITEAPEGITGYGGGRRVLSSSVTVRLESSYNTNEIEYTDLADMNGDGVPETPVHGFISPGSFRLQASATAYFDFEDLRQLPDQDVYVPPGETRALQFGNVNVSITSVTVGGRITIERGRHMVNQPGYKMAESGVVYEIKTDAVYEGTVTIRMSAGDLYWQHQKDRADIYHCDEAMNCAGLNAKLEGDSLVANPPGLSPFTLMIPVYDGTPPQTTLAVFGTREELEGKVWVTTETYVSLAAADSSNHDDISGPATTYYLVGYEPTLECLNTPYNEAAAPGSCANPVYGGSFTLAEGSHTIHYMSSDNWGNHEAPKSEEFYVDGTPPAAQLKVNGVAYADGALIAAVAGDTITITAEDIVSNGVASGLATAYLLIDIDPETCENGGSGGGVDGSGTGQGSCENPYYQDPLMLAEGTHTVYYSAEDGAGNRAALKSARLEIAPRARTYYVDALGGADENDGKTAGSAFRSIAAGLAAAAGGDTVLVATGVYRESLDITTAGVTLRSAGGAVLDGGGLLGYAFQASGAGVRVEGFVVENYAGFGIIAGGGAAVVAGNTIRNITGEAAIQAAECANCVIERNTITGAAAGIRAHSDAGLAIRGNLVYGVARQGISVLSGPAVVSGNTVYGAGSDATHWERAGIAFYDAPGVVVKNNIVAGGHAGLEALNYSGYARADYNDVWGNALDYTGLAAGAHDISVDPGFVNAGGGDFRLLEGSPCLGAGEGGANMGHYSGEPAAPPALEAVHLRDIGGYGTTAGRLNAPTGVAIGPWGNGLYVTDTYNFRIQKFTLDGRFLLEFGRFGSGPGEFGGGVQTVVGPDAGEPGPAGDGVSRYGMVFVADPGNWRVQRFDSNGGFVSSFGTRGSGPGQFEGLYWVGVDSVTANVYASDETLDRVQVFGHGGNYLGVLGAGLLSAPRGVAVENAAGGARVYVVDKGHGRVVVFRADGGVICAWPLKAADPSGIHADGYGRVYVTDLAGAIYVYGREGGYKGSFGGPGPDPLQFNLPMGVTSDPAGHLYVADSLNDRVQKLHVRGEDRSAPSPVGNVAAAYLAPHYAALTLDAPDDDSGGAAFYDVRVSSLGALWRLEDFERAESALLPYAPLPGGQRQELTVGGLGGAAAWHIALRSADSGGNYSEITSYEVELPTAVARGDIVLAAGFTGAYGYGRNDGYPAITAAVDNSRGVAIGPDGGVYFAQGYAQPGSGNSVVRRIDPVSNIVTTYAGSWGSGFSGDGGPAAGARLNDPYGVSFDVAGNMYIADTAGNRVRRVNAADGVITTVAGSGAPGYGGDGGPAAAASLSGPRRAAADAAGNVYIADTGNNVVRRVRAADGVIETVAGGSADLNCGDVRPALACGLKMPADVEITGDGGVYIAEQGGGAVWRLDAASGLLEKVGDFAGPADVALSPDGGIYVAERAAHRVVLLSGGARRVVAGTGSQWRDGLNGPAVERNLWSPEGVAGDWARGVLYIVDHRRVTAVGIAPVSAPGTERYYVSASSGSDANDGRSAAAAFATIAKAVSAASPGAEINVLPGVYAESVAVTVPGLTLRAAPGAALDGDADGDGVRLESAFAVDQARRVKIEGFSIRGYNTALLLNGASFSAVTGNTISGVQHAVQANYCSGCVISSNAISASYSGITESGLGNVVRGNLLFALESEGIAAQGEGVAVLNNTVYRAGRWSAAISVNAVSAAVKNNIAAGSGLGVSLYSDPGVAAHNAVWDNVSDYAGEFDTAQDVAADPRFLFPPGGDFRLAADSPCLGSGEGGVNIGYYQGPGLAPYSAVSSTVTVGGRSELVAVSTAAYELAPAAGEPLAGALAACEWLGYAPLTGIYDIRPAGERSEVWLTFTLPEGAVSDPAALAIYRYDGVAWSSSSVTSQARELRDGYWTLTGRALYTSLFGVLRELPDTQAPVTALAVSGPGAVVDGLLYLGAGGALELTARDPGRSGVAVTYYAPGADPAGALAYTGPLTFGDGRYEMVYWSVDNAGNAEAPLRAGFAADAAPPVSSWTARGYAEYVDGVLYAAPATSLGFEAYDAGSGTAAIRYAVDPGTNSVNYALYGSTFSLGLGAHTLAYYAEDLAGNAEPPRRLNVEIVVPADVTAAFEPAVLNAGSGGRYVTLVLEPGGNIAPGSLRVTAVNGAAAGPLAPADAGGRRGAPPEDADGDGAEELRLKFDRASLLELLPAGEQVSVRVEGAYADGGAFSAEAYVRVLAPAAWGKGGLKVARGKASVELPAGALAGEAGITVTRLAAEFAPAAARKSAAAGKAGLQRLGDAYDFGPEGVWFVSAATVTLAYDGALVPPGREPAVAWWRPEAGVWEVLPSSVNAAGGEVSAAVGHFSVYQAVLLPARPRARAAAVAAAAGPPGEFRLGEVYVFPNPAKGGQEPVFHVECGLADSVRITVYTVSGRQAHEHTLAGQPAALDDGNGLSYAYEYAWRGHIPSGVYYYHVEAVKAGQKLKKSGKFAVVR